MNDNPNIATSETQCNKIAAYLESGKAITSLEALTLFGCFRLASRISDLKKRGYDIAKKMVKTATGKSVAQYTLNDERADG